jgi:Ca2+-binding RTX toxin-like protein
VAADGLFSAALDGGAGNDTVTVEFENSWHILGTMRLRIDGGLGNDALTCRLSNSSATTGAYDVAVRGGAGKDTVAFKLDKGIGSPTFGPAGKVLLDGGTGLDALTNETPTVSYATAFELVL